jgi:[ribosomal protein S18]-alanine N-acetyltransferase
MLRPLFKSDLKEILPIEETVHLSPWSRETFETCLNAGAKGWVVEDHDKIVGFIVVMMHDEDCHILNICVRRAYQHQGYGRRLMEHVLHIAKEKGVQVVYLEVRRSNVHAISLYSKLNFVQIGERKNYYQTSGVQEDALVFGRSLV